MLPAKRMACALTGVFAIALLSVGTMSAGAVKKNDSAVTISDEAASKTANDTDPHRPLTPYQQKMLALKDQAIADFLSGKTDDTATDTTGAKAGASSLSISAASATASASGAYPSISGVLMNQTPQLTKYWCGPATTHEALHQLGQWVTQATLATKLGTTTAGTGWSVGPTKPTGFPIADVLNAHQSKNTYVPISVPITYGGYLEPYKNRLMQNIAVARAPLIGDAWEVSGSQYRLDGHPRDQTIFHWFDIRGYTESGVNTMYEDSVHGASSIAWAANVPAYSTIASWKILKIVSGRGYIW